MDSSDYYKNNIKLNEIKHKSYKSLWMPEGSIRAVLALIVIGTISYCVICGIKMPDWYVPIASTVLVFYFKKDVK